MEDNLSQLKETLTRARHEVGKIIIGQDDVIEKCLIVIFTGQHALIEGVPGVAKTLLVKTLGAVLGCESSRIQFTPDLMPADITGTNIYDMHTGKFNLMPGPVFTTFLVADEINRAPAKTQAALLQAMQERVVTIDRATYALPQNFTVFATQNPIEFEGTYPLPEAQKDRFMFKVSMPCPGRDEEVLLAQRTLGKESPEVQLKNGAVQPVVTSEKLAELRQALELVAVRDELMGYIVDLVRATREHQSVLSGAGPRATQCLALAGRAHAAIQDRDFVTPDDLRAVALPVLEHRINLRPEYEIEGLTTAEVVQKILAEVPVPR